MRKRREYSRRKAYPNKSYRGQSPIQSFIHNNRVRRWIVAAALVLLAGCMLFLMVCGCLYLHDRAVEKKEQKVAQTYGDQLSGQNGEKVLSGDDIKQGIGAENNSAGGSGTNVANIENFQRTPQPSTIPEKPSPQPTYPPNSSAMPAVTPEPTSNGHELDDEMVIVIDAGHGGHDGGSDAGDTIEKDINLAVAKEIARLLEEHGGITVVQTRTSDVYLDRQERCDIANEAKSDYFVSVHCNSYNSDASVHGLEVHYYEKSKEGEKFAQAVTDDMKQYKDMKIRSIKPNDLAVTRHTYCPAILIEMGFLTNPTECANLGDPDYQKQLAQRIADAILSAAGL